MGDSKNIYTYDKYCYQSQLEYEISRKVQKNKVLKIICVRKIKSNLKFYRTSAGKSTFRTQNDTDKANFGYTTNKEYCSYYVRNHVGNMPFCEHISVRKVQTSRTVLRKKMLKL